MSNWDEFDEIFGGDYDDDGENEEPNYMVMLGFADVSDLIKFIEWVNVTFADPQDLQDWFDAKIADQYSHPCTRNIQDVDNTFTCTVCDATFTTSAGLLIHQKNLHKNEIANDPFWDVINNSFINHQSGVNDDGLSGSA